MWGQDTNIWARCGRIRIIPTRVGTSLAPFSPLTLVMDHPHACGDKTNGVYGLLSEVGSSPRVWGQGMQFVRLQQYLRIIPTRVGTRLTGRENLQAERDHPHACGDKQIPFPMLVRRSGSSPRVWGQVKLPEELPPNVRIIPTRVGTSGNYTDYSYDEQDHPHACGDKHTSYSSKTEYTRIIPTRVGTSISRKRFS